MAGGAQDENPVAINVVAMVDIIFCLCLFFMCSLKFQPLDAKFDSWLPREDGQRVGEATKIVDETRVLLSWNHERNRVDRIFGQGRLVPSTPEGDVLLRDLIRAQEVDARRRAVPDARVIIDSGPAVPWNAVVDVMDLARDAGFERIAFGVGTKLGR